MKKLAFCLIATLFVSVLPTNAQNLPKGFMKIDVGFEKVSSYAGPCISGSGFCSGSASGTVFTAAISKVSESTVSYAFSSEFYQANRPYLDSGLRVGAGFSLPKVITEKIGITGEFIVAPGTYQVTENDGIYYASVARFR